MINNFSKDEQDLIKKQLIGYGYASKIQSYFKKENIKNANGTEFSKSSIRGIVNNKTTSKTAVVGILNLLTKLMKTKEKEAILRENLLKNNIKK
jgi:hypothetical protein